MTTKDPSATKETSPKALPGQGYSASDTVEWNFTVPPSNKRSGKLTLLTIGGISVTGNWYGELGENFVAWTDLLKYDKDQFNAVVADFKARKAAESESKRKTH